jgi:hypothetical protein
LAEIIKSFEGDVFRFGSGLDQFCEGTEGIADPGHDDGPALDTAMAVDALLERSELQDFVHGELAGLFDFAFDGNGPGRSYQSLGIFCRVGFVAAEFVEVIVVGDVLMGVLFLRGAETVAGKGCKSGIGENDLFWRSKIPHFPANESGGAHSGEKFAAIQIDGLRCYVRVDQIRAFANQHGFLPIP